MKGLNHLALNPKAQDKSDDIERTLKFSHVETMPTSSKNYYQDLLKRFSRVKRRQIQSTLASPPVP